MMRCRIVVLSIAAALIAVVLSQAAFAGAQSYIDRPRMIKAGVLVPDSDMGPVFPPVPYIFLLMGERNDLKPNGWEFENPLSGGNDSFKTMPPYWMVPLSQTTLENLAKFDILYLSTSQQVKFKMRDRDKLRRYVDGGGCLWVDDAGGMSFPTSSCEGFFIPGVNFKVGAGGGYAMPAQRLHPLLTTPFWLNQTEIAMLGDVSLTHRGIDPGFPSALGATLPAPNVLAPVVVNGSTVTCAAIEYGSGRVVFTSGFVGGMMTGTLTIPLPGMSMNPAGAIGPLKFAYNVVAYSSSYTTFRKDYRRTGVLCDSLDAPLIYKWSCPQARAVAGGGPLGSETGAVIWKNAVFYSSGDTLYCIDIGPENDLDMNGNPDDGLADNVGGRYDIIWKYDCGSQISTPTIATMLDPASNPLKQKDFVIVNCRDGRVYVFEAFPTTLSDVTILSSASNPRMDMWPNSFAMGTGDSALLPAVAQNGWIYASSTDGFVYGYSPLLEKAGSGGVAVPNPSWSVDLRPMVGAGAVVTLKYGPTMAFIKNQTTGAVTQTLSYLGRYEIPGMPGIWNDRIFSVPVYVSGDRLTPITRIDVASSGPITFWTSNRNLKVASYPYPEAWAVDQNATREFPLDVKATGVQGQVEISCDSSHLIGPNTVVYMSYANDFSGLIPGSYSMPNYELQPKIPSIGSSPAQTIDIQTTATPAIGPDDRFYFGIKWNGTGVSSIGTGSSSVYAVWFDGNSNTAKLEWNYFLHGGGDFLDPSQGPASTAHIPLESVAMSETKQLWGVHAKVQNPPGANETLYPVQGLQVNCTPAVSGDRVFVTASTQNPGRNDLSRGYLLCFKARPTFQIRLGRPLIDMQNQGRRMSVRIWQPDMLFDTATTTQTAYGGSYGVPSSMIDYDTGTITITDFSKVRMAGWLGAIQTCTFTPSLPVWVFVDNVPVPLREVDYSSWDNLLWACPMPDHKDINGNPRPCSGIDSSPIVCGDYVYFTDNDGYMYAVAVDTAPKDPALKVLDPTDSDAKKWMPMADPIAAGAGSGHGAKVSLAASNGTLIVPTSNGLFALKNDKSLVTDNRRVMELGSDGKISWSCDAISIPMMMVSGSLTALYDIGPTNLSKPVMAQKLDSSDYLVVDSGNDRVLRITRSGEVTWAVKSFNDDLKHLLRSGEPLKLRAPADAMMWNEYEKVDGQWYYVVHCLVVDSGNFRILDIVDRYLSNDQYQILGPMIPDAMGRPTHQLNWVSYTSYKDKSFTFNSAQLVKGPTRQDIWASVANYGLGTSTSPSDPNSTGALGGAIVQMKYRESDGDYGWNYFQSDQVIAQLTTLTEGGNKIALSGPRYFQVLNQTVPSLLICDTSAVYITGADNSITAKLTDEEYRNLGRKVIDQLNSAVLTNVVVPIPFHPQRAQMLPNGHILITNGFAGRIFDPEKSKFTGEILETDGALSTIYWYAPDIWKVTPANGGGFLQKLLNAPNLDQPTCAQRLF